MSTWRFQRHLSCCNGRMNVQPVDAPSYSGYRFLAVVISHCAWLYFRFALSYRDVEEMMAEGGVTVTYESVRE
jgi:transposase-like protein